MVTPIGSPRVPSTVGSSLVTPVARDAVEPDDSAHAARCASHASLARSANATLLASPAEDDQSAPLHVPLLPCTALQRLARLTPARLLPMLVLCLRCLRFLRLLLLLRTLLLLSDPLSLRGDPEGRPAPEFVWSGPGRPWSYGLYRPLLSDPCT